MRNPQKTCVIPWLIKTAKELEVFCSSLFKFLTYFCAQWRWVKSQTRGLTIPKHAEVWIQIWTLWLALPPYWLEPKPPLPCTPNCDMDENTCGKLCSYAHITPQLSSLPSSQSWLKIWLKPSGAPVLSSSSLYLSFSPHLEIFLHTMPTESPQSWNAYCHLDYAREADSYWKHSFPFILCCSHAVVGSFRCISEGKRVKCMQLGSGPVKHFMCTNICSCALLLICRRLHMGAEIRVHQTPLIKCMCL